MISSKQMQTWDSGIHLCIHTSCSITGARPQVFQVQKKDTGQVYAMKVMRKERIIAKDHGDYVKAERNVLTAVFHPYIVTLRCSFQVRHCCCSSPYWVAICCQTATLYRSSGFGSLFDSAQYVVCASDKQQAVPGTRFYQWRSFVFPVV